jgi:uncharacterized protein GlcG (DUF336 family)
MSMLQLSSRAALMLVLAMLALGGTSFAQTPPGQAPQAPPPTLPPQTISLAEARVIIEGTIALAREKNARLGVVVLDAASGELVAGEHMDGAPGRNIMFAEGKAYASILYRTTSEALSNLYKTRPDRYFGITNMYGNKVYLVGGGIPLVVDGLLVGAVGVAGTNQDELFAQAGIAAWEKARGSLRK